MPSFTTTPQTKPISEPAIISLPERLDSATASALENAVLANVKGGTYDMLLDATQVRFMTAAGLRAILSSLRALQAVEGSLAVRGLRAQPWAMFTACGFDSLIPVLDTDKTPLPSVA